MYDRYNRHITYLRVSVTDRCNLRCSYCMPEHPACFMPSENILSIDEITEILKVGVSLGIDKIRLTGGEPLVRNDIVDLVSHIRSIDGIKDLAMTTNGVLLSNYARPLKKAGLDRINISLDTLNSAKFKKLTRGGDLSRVLQGIDAAIDAGLLPVKINFVRLPGQNENDESEVRNYCTKKGIQIRFIRQMNFETGEFAPVEGGEGGVCHRCNRLRLTADGTIKPCLHSDYGYNVKDLGIEQAFEKALYMKPKEGSSSHSHKFYNIGG